MQGFPEAQTPQSSPTPPPGKPDAGRTLFMKNGCFQCHGAEAQGGAAGPRLSPYITLRAAPLSLASGAERLAVMRSEPGRPDACLGSLVAAADALDPTRPGLWFSVRFEGAVTVVDVAVTVDAPCDAPGGAVVRATTSVRVASE